MIIIPRVDNYDPNEMAPCKETRAWIDNGFIMMRVTSADTYQPRKTDIITAARRTHAEGYLEQGLATEAAVTTDRTLSREIDKSGGLNGVTYYLAQHIERPADKATGRLIPATQLGQLATFGLVSPAISQEGIQDLKTIIDPSSPYQLSELGALAKSRYAHEQKRQEGSVTIIRAVLRDTVGRNTFLFCSMVEEARNGLAGVLTAENLNPIGEPVLLEENKYRRKTTLIPLLIDPNDFVRNIYQKYIVTAARSKENPDDKICAKQANALLKSMIFFAEDLADEYVPVQVREIEKFAKAKESMRVDKSA